MKTPLIALAFILFSTILYAQEETITLSGGVVYSRAIDYSSYYPVDYNTKSQGFRITGLYEIGPMKPKKLIHGIGAGYILTTSNYKSSGYDLTLKVRTLPFYYAPKFMLGNESAMIFARGAVGIQFAKIKVEGDYNDHDTDWGFYGGIALGGMVYVSKKIFLNLEYEYAFMSNTYYANGVLNTLQAGIGIDL